MIIFINSEFLIILHQFKLVIGRKQLIRLVKVETFSDINREIFCTVTVVPQRYKGILKVRAEVNKKYFKRTILRAVW